MAGCWPVSATDAVMHMEDLYRLGDGKGAEEPF